MTDGALAVAIAAFQEIGAVSSPADVGLADHLAILAGSLVLAGRRRAPRTVLAVTTACMLLYTVRAQPGPAAAFPVLIAMATATFAGHRVPAALASVAYLGGTLAAAYTAAGGRPDPQVVQGTPLLLGWFVAAGVAGAMARHRQAYLAQVEQRALDAERTREEAALRRAGEERLRIARELHDSLTHSISIIKVQAGVAVHLARKRGDEVPPALLAIQEASAAAMRELRETLEVLRDPPPADPGTADPPATGSDTADPGAAAGDGGGPGGAPATPGGDDPAAGPPASGLHRLEELVGRARAAGLPVTVTVSGERRPLPAAVDRAAYRIVQESLTNVARHAGPAAADVHLGYDPERLVVQVDDDGDARPQAPVAPGVGLSGMRERVTALGGRLAAGPRPGGGFSVRAELPAGERP
ncbi:two-component sensor histidine kinase [Sphaerisporangium rufum]|uniref:histidine kinase n=2 Tax=Sphaerisporangium rufum TaxID=1381558 RepID=A0A919R1K0_9ACTN|nr:two-component sensor histidine kinase [Sphaerisporangium rufum]